MADEYGQETPIATEPTQPQGDVTIKAAAIEPNPIKGDKPDLPPYHTEETHQIAQDRAEELKGQDKEYSYCANGYTVREIDAAEGVTTENGKVYEVTAEGFAMAFANKRAAEIYAETHSAAHKDLPVTISKA